MTHSIRKALLPGLLFFLPAAFLTGCSRIDELVTQTEDVWVPESTAVEIGKDGPVKETVLDTLDKDYYDAGELKALVSEAVSDYNTAAGSEKVTVSEEDTLIEDRQVKLVMTYASAEDYAAFNDTTLFSGSMLSAQVEGFLFYHEFYRVKDGVCEEEPISNEEPLALKESQVLISDLSHMVRVPGRILYVSSNAVTADAYTAVPSVDAPETDTQGLVLPSNTVYLETQETEITPEELEDNMMYVIYEF